MISKLQVEIEPGKTSMTLRMQPQLDYGQADPPLCLIAPNGLGGITDYTEVLRRNIVGNSVVLRPGEQEEKRTMWEDTDNAGSEKYSAVLIQYCGYGFQRRGAPYWLPKWTALQKRRGQPVGCFFHELYAFGPPWRSSFWLSPMQRHIAAELARLSDFWITNRSWSAEWLLHAAREKPYAVLPVFSNVGESTRFSRERSPRVIVFGSAGLRQAAYTSAGRSLFEWAGKAGLQIHDVGPALEASLTTALSDAGVICHGYLDVAEIRTLFQDAMFGLIAYPTACLGKSGVFAAYCAYGICPIVYSTDYAPVDKLESGTHYLAGHGLNSGLALTSLAVGEAAWAWYQDHGVQSHVETVARFSGIAEFTGATLSP